MKCIHIVETSGVERDVEFTFAHERVTFLLLKGFIEQDGHWFHPFDQAVANFYDKGNFEQRETNIKQMWLVQDFIMKGA